VFHRTTLANQPWKLHSHKKGAIGCMLLAISDFLQLVSTMMYLWEAWIPTEGKYKGWKLGKIIRTSL